MSIKVIHTYSIYSMQPLCNNPFSTLPMSQSPHPFPMAVSSLPQNPHQPSISVHTTEAINDRRESIHVIPSVKLPPNFLLLIKEKIILRSPWNKSPALRRRVSPPRDPRAANLEFLALFKGHDGDSIVSSLEVAEGMVEVGCYADCDEGGEY